MIADNKASKKTQIQPQPLSSKSNFKGYNTKQEDPIWQEEPIENFKNLIELFQIWIKKGDLSGTPPFKHNIWRYPKPH